MFKVERYVEGAWYFWGRYDTEEQAMAASEYLVSEYGMSTRVVRA